MLFQKNAALAVCLAFVLALGTAANAQTDVKPFPVLTGATSYFTRVTGGVVQDSPSVSPLLLYPVGDKWLLEAKGFYSDNFAKNKSNVWEGTMSYGLGYAEIDYLANRYLTVTAGRFTTPFGIYGERYAPVWVRALQTGPLTTSLARGASNGGMLRGGVSVNPQVNFNYAVYFSSAVTNHIVTSDRTSGGRFGVFLPRPGLEVGGSFQKSFQQEHSRAAGMHFVWQPSALPLSLRSEYSWSEWRGSGYWVEAAYRLSQIPRGRPFELVGRGQQFYAGNLKAATLAKLGVLTKDTQQADMGLNYYLGNDVRISGGYGRQFSLGKDTHLWTVGLTYRFVMPAFPGGGAR